MTDAVDLSQTKDIKQSLLLGLGKAPLSGADPLATLSLVAMRGKFARPARPTAAADTGVSHELSAKYLLDESRAKLVRLLSGKDAKIDDGIANGILRAIKASGLRLHPFDYARLEDFIACHAADLGPEERAWLKLVRPDRKPDDDPYLDGPLTEETLPQASKAQKLRFLRELRASDSARAGEFIAKLMPNEPANMRGELVGILAARLDEADRQFLESLAQDRAQSVRDAASELLGRIRGTDAFAKRIERLKDYVKIKTEGLLRRHKVLKLVEPAASKSAEGYVGARALFGGLHLKDIADALGESESSLLEAASRTEKAGMAPFLLLVAAVKDGLIDLATKYQSIHEGDNGEHTIEFLREALPFTDGAARDQALRIAVRPKSWRESPNPFIVEQAAACIASPLPVDLATEIVELPFWSSSESDGRYEHLAAVLAPLIPRELSHRFVTMSESVSRRATLYHRFLLSLPEQ
ncbi:MAG: DUF5691 domain-containing protein [Aestuariivirga sp.]